MVFEIRGKNFNIELVNNWVHEKYVEMSHKAYDLIDKKSELDKIHDEGKKELDEKL